MTLLREVYAVIGQRDVPLPDIGKTDAQSLRQGLAELGKGAGVLNELHAWTPLAHSHWRRCNQQDLASIQGYTDEEPLQPLGGLLWASPLKQIVGPQHDDQQICVSRKGGSGGWNLAAVLSHVRDRPSGLRSQDVHPSVVCLIPPTEITSGVISVGIGVTETDDVHSALFLSLAVLVIIEEFSVYFIVFSLVRISSSAGQKSY